jgi:hypothetical protein
MKFFKYIKIFFLAFAFVLVTTNCEKDDICDPATETTPMLTIEFYDAVETTILKNVQNLTVQEIDSNERLNFNKDLLGTPQYTITANKISIPLKTLELQTTYRLIFNANNNDIKNEDIVQFNYQTQNIYLNRACGFKTIYQNLTQPIVSNPNNDNLFWINQMQVTNNQINSSKDVHVKIYF